MSHNLVKILFDEDGEKIDEPVWHLVVSVSGSPATLCTGEVFGEGEGNAVYEEKQVNRGGITCKKCLEQLRDLKSVKL